MNKKKWRQTKILDVKVDFVSMNQAVNWVEEQVNYNKVGQIVTPNPEQVVLAKADEEFARALNSADLSICDGVGLLWAVKIQNLKSLFSWRRILRPSTGGDEAATKDRRTAPSDGAGRTSFLRNGKNQSANWRTKFKNFKIQKKQTPPRWPKRSSSSEVYPQNAGTPRTVERADKLVSRLTGTDLMLALCQKAAQKDWRVFLLGGRRGVAKEAARTLNTKYQILNTTYSSGASDITRETEEERGRIIDQINHFHPHLLFVAYGAPYQEKWLAKNLPRLKVNVAMGVGGAFDYLTGKVARAPNCVRVLGFEWLWRLLAQPWRIKRQLNLLKFIWLVLLKKMLFSFRPNGRHA